MCKCITQDEKFKMILYEMEFLVQFSLKINASYVLEMTLLEIIYLTCAYKILRRHLSAVKFFSKTFKVEKFIGGRE